MKNKRRSSLRLLFTMIALLGGFIVSSNAQLISNGSFEANPAGTAVVIGATPIADDSTFTSWRFFSVGSPPIDGFSLTSVTNASDGNRAVQIDMTDTGIGVAADRGLDRYTSRVPVEYGKDYTFAFDAARISGTISLTLMLAEYDAAGNFLAQQLENYPITSSTYESVTLNWTPSNPATTSLYIRFVPNNAGAETALSMRLDNVRLTLQGFPEAGLYTPMATFNRMDHVVSTSFFHWFTSGAGQITGPWPPLEGRSSWTGEADWWKGQIKQTMMANIDILYVHLIPTLEQQRINLFYALNLLRYEGYDVPKVLPFLDPIITWDAQPNINAATTAGKDEFVSHYTRFFNQYYSVNQDVYADDYLAKFDGQIILDSWHTDLNVDNLPSLTRNDVSSRLLAEFGTSSPFTNDIYMISTVNAGTTFSFLDEKVIQFEAHSYYEPASFNGIDTAQVKPGYWDQNVRTPGTLFPRNGGSNYIAAWNSVNANAALEHVYIESFNEYDEGSGIYAADTSTNSPYLTGGNTGSDTWSTSNDPYEYLKITANGAAAFNDTAEQDALIVWHNFPTNMAAGTTQLVSVVVRNTGDASWTAAGNYKFGDKADGGALFGEARYLIDDNADEIPLYGGIFRGRPKTFELTLVAPAAPGVYATQWSMVQEGVAWFGQGLNHSITVEAGPTTTATITAAAAYGIAGDLFQGATVTANHAMHPAGFVVTDLFSSGSATFSEDVVFVDSDGNTLSFVEFNTLSAVDLGNITLGLINDHVVGDNNDGRTLNNIKVYASASAGTVMNNLVADIPVDPEYTTAYGGNQITVSIDMAVNAQYFRVEFTETGPSGVRVMEIDGYAPVAPNNAPVFTVDPMNRTAAVDALAYSDTLSGSATDADLDPLSYSKGSGPAWLSIATDGTLSGTPATGDIGPNSWTVLVSDGNGGSDTAILNIAVQAVPNNAPVFTVDPIDRSDAMEGAVYNDTLAGLATDADLDLLSYSKISGPAWLTVAIDGSLAGTPALSDAGITNSWTVEVSDGNGGTDQAQLSIMVLSILPKDDLALSEITTFGTVSGTLAQSYQNDNLYETLTEAVDGSPTSLLEHEWAFNVYGAELVTFYVEAHHTANSEGDDFIFAYSTDQVVWVDMVTVTKTADDNTAQWYALPSGLNGTVYVRVLDTDRGVNNTTQDSLSVDALFIYSEESTVAPNPSTGPVPANGALDIPLNQVLSWTAGAMVVEHDVYFGTSPAPVFQVTQSNTTYNPGPLANSTLYYWAVDEANNSGTTAGSVWSFTTVAAPNTAPAFTSDPVVELNGTENTAYSSSLVDDATDVDSDPLTFSRVSGPAWLSVATSGALSGTPTPADVGLNSWTVEVSDGNGGVDSATLQITVDAVSVPLPGQASNPNPDDRDRDVSTSVTLSWTAGSNASSHNVYFGTGGNLVFMGNQAGTTFAPGSLNNKTRYFWRIDEVNATGTTTGEEWIFNTVR